MEEILEEQNEYFEKGFSHYPSLTINSKISDSLWKYMYELGHEVSWNPVKDEYGKLTSDYKVFTDVIGKIRSPFYNGEF
jgi:hypothetical protein